MSLAGLAAGLVLGLAYAWLIDPVRPTNAYPALLRSDYRDSWVYVAALSYMEDGDVDLVRSRLAGMDELDVRTGLARVVDSDLGTPRLGQRVGRARALAAAYEMPFPTKTAETWPDATTPSDARIEPPSAMSYRVARRSHVCMTQDAPRIEVTILDSAGDGVPGVRLWLVWDGGSDAAITGLMSDQSPGYADFAAQPEVVYTLGLGEYGMPLLSGFMSPPCPEDQNGDERVGSWHIVIEERPDEGSGT